MADRPQNNSNEKVIVDDKSRGTKWGTVVIIIVLLLVIMLFMFGLSFGGVSDDGGDTNSNVESPSPTSQTE